MSGVRILVVEDESIVAEDLKRSLENMGYNVPAVAYSGEEAVKTAEEIRPDLVLMDIVLRDKMNGIDAAGHMRSTFDIPVIYLTAYSDANTIDRAKKTEPFGYIIKPFDDNELRGAVETALYKHGMEKKLKESREWLSTVLKSIGDAVIAADSMGLITFMNPVAETLTGWRHEEALGKPMDEVFIIISEETGEKVESPVKKVLREGIVVGLANHTLLINKDGDKIPIDDSGAPIKDERGKVSGIVLVFHDVAERKKAEELILQSKHDWEETFDTITDMITVHDKDFNIIRANKAAEKMLGPDVLESKGIKCFKGYHGTNNPPDRCPSCECLKTEKPTHVEYFEPHLNKFLEIRAMPRFDKKNQLTGLIHVVRDISSRKEMEKEIKNKVEELERFYDMAIGRELKMRDLKKEIDSLKEHISALTKREREIKT